tara:strand:+ start:337 stop:450 length:114 start_codon:yes stop_codon:yes gene_type:complete
MGKMTTRSHINASSGGEVYSGVEEGGTLGRTKEGFYD